MKLFDVYPRFDITLTNGKGVYIYDDRNEEYLDLYGGHGVISIGHAHPTYTQNIKDQLDAIGFYSNAIQMPIQNELALKLAEQSAYPDHALFLCNSGAEANENALKLASFHTGKKKVIAFKGSFHGRTAAALNVTDNANLSAPINTDNFPVEFIVLNEEESLVNALKAEDVCAVIVEGIQGVGGLDAPTEDYFLFLSETCKQYGVLLILDEIQSGMGRTGKFFAHQYANINADIITMAKGFGNGFPIGALLIDPKIKAKPGMLGTTFGGNHLACAAGIAVLETIKKENILTNVKAVSEYLIHALESISAIKRIKGKGLMLGIEFDFPIRDLRAQLLKEYHIFTGASANPNLLRILPPLGISKEEIQPFILALKEILS
ncbi:aspartate aminotransferase family protein [Putridiphycobacter roseus]|uniref:Aspartate aminotransferase family protein n=1 Tax=Putridiphycobacter roseus TaxID=2219161 RepID=A0A2W1N1I9_9FLAO|nr:aminotransferase class III-fold pyridoxal phosphate-dependent enzyme [Putridiphycobacter roseus]PZE17664.1 aspartate aminotransferase family protein [Putridiphycobacter roseus]